MKAVETEGEGAIKPELKKANKDVRGGPVQPDAGAISATVAKQVATIESFRKKDEAKRREAFKMWEKQAQAKAAASKKRKAERAAGAVGGETADE